MDDIEEIMEQIRRKALSYTKEWRFDREQPDIGTALAIVYAQMLHETIKRYCRLPFKMQRSFFNTCGASLLPAEPAEGFLQFFPVNEEAGGTLVPKGTLVSADGQDKKLSYETMEDVYAVPSEVVCMYQTWDERDMVVRIYDGSHPASGTVLFSDTGSNLQEHLLFFCHDNALLTQGPSSCLITFDGRDEKPVRREWMTLLANPANAVFSYSCEGGFHPFSVQKEQDGRILLMKTEAQPACTELMVDGVKSGWIQCRILSYVPVKNWYLSGLHFCTYCGAAEPDNLSGCGLPYETGYFLPFGEEPALFSEAYIGGGEVFNKKGAKVTVSFCLDQIRTPYGDWEREEIQWNWVMKKIEKKKEVIYETAISSVIWEYYNGMGWTNLFQGDANACILSADEEGGPYRTLQFVCPSDLEPVQVGACENRYIRVRIIKVTNPYKTKGYFIAPVLSNLTLCYAYQEDALRPRRMVIQNNLRMERFTAGNPFYQTGLSEKAIYMGLNHAPTGTPVRFLLQFQEYLEEQEAEPCWQYYGNGTWNPLNEADETEGLKKTGVLTFQGRSDFSLLRLFGEERYWVRILDRENLYGDQSALSVCPVLTGIYANAARARQLGCIETEYFQMEAYQENAVFNLLHQNIYQISLWVSEKNENGEMEFINWSEVPDFSKSECNDHHFRLFPAEGKIAFGNGRKGKIPPISERETIKVVYRCGGGNDSNQRAGTIQKLDSSIGFINRAINPLPFAGGQDMENIQEAIMRCGARLRHQNRAITERDYESLALEASRDIVAARCFTDRSRITMVLLLKNAEKMHARFPEIKKLVRQYLLERSAGAISHKGRLTIREPEYARICVKAELTTDRFENVLPVRKIAYRAVGEYLSPVNERSGEGLNIGQLPAADQIRNAIYSKKEMQPITIRNMYIRIFLKSGNGYRETDALEASAHPFLLAVNGDHDITVLAERR